MYTEILTTMLFDVGNYLVKLFALLRLVRFELVSELELKSINLFGIFICNFPSTSLLV